MPALKTRGTATIKGMTVRRATQHEVVTLINPCADVYEVFARANLEIVRSGRASVVKQNAHLGEKLALCGAGPSLATYKHLIDGVDRVWACNSALPYLVEAGVHVDAGIAIDQTPGMLRDWPDPPDVDYFIASTCDPKLTEHLLAHGRRVVFFHNLVAFDGEMEHYREDWPPSFMVDEGTSVVPRVVGLAAWLGFQRIDVYGADCCFSDDIAHANGETWEQAFGDMVMMKGEIDGREFLTRPDFLQSAVDLVRRQLASPGRIRLIGDTLPVSLMGKDDDYLTSVSRWMLPGELPGEHVNGEQNGQQD